MIAYYTSPLHNCDTFSPFSLGSNSLFNDVMHQLDKQFYYNQSQIMLEKMSRPSSVRQVETADSYQIQIGKRFGNFNGYEVRIVKNSSGDYLLKIDGRSDKFERLYELDPKTVEVSEIDWKWYRNENVLVLNIPKRESRHEERKKLKSVKKSNSKKSSHRRKERHEKNLQRKLGKLGAAIQEQQRQRNSEQEEEEYNTEQENVQRKPISNEAMFEHEEDIEMPSSPDSNAALESDGSSETESMKSEPIKAKINRLPSIEEVEDEEFTLVRKNMI